MLIALIARIVRGSFGERKDIQDDKGQREKMADSERDGRLLPSKPGHSAPVD